MPSRVSPMTGLIEREAEAATLSARLTDAVAGRGAIVSILGEAGLGKTALAGGLAKEAERSGVRVLWASAGELERRTPFGVVRRLFDRALMDLSESTRTGVTAGPAQVASRHVLEVAEDPVDQAAMFASLYWLLDGLAALGPVLVVLDDAPWADEDSLLFLRSIADRITDLPVLVVLTARDTQPSGRSPGLAALLADRQATVLRLRPLSPPAVATLLMVEPVPAEAVFAELATTAAEITGGVPFLVLALAGLLRETLTEQSGDPIREVDLVRTLVPESVVDSVVARLGALNEDALRVAQAVAVLERAPLRVVADLVGLSPGRTATAVDLLREAGLLGDDKPLRFRHDLLRSAVARAIRPAETEVLRRSAARLLADGVGEHQAAAQLLEVDGVGDAWAVDLLCRAADSALVSGAPKSAIALLRRAAAEPPTPERRGEVLLTLGLTELRDADPACVDTLTTAHALVADPVARARCALALASAFGYAGFHSRAIEVLERALSEIGEAPTDPASIDPELVGEVEAGLIEASLLVPSAIPSARARLASLGPLSGRTRGERLLLIQQASNASGTNQHADVIRGYARRAIGDWSSAEQQPESTKWAWARLFLSAAGDYDEVRDLATAAIADSAANGSVLGYVTASFVRGMALWWAGDLVAAEADFQAMLDRAELLGGGILVQTLAFGGLAQTLTEQGRVEEAQAILTRLPAIDLPADAPVNGAVQLLRARSLTRAASGDHEGAIEDAECCARRMQDLDVDSPTWASWRSLAIPPLGALGRGAQAQQLAVEELALCERSGVPRLIGQALRLAAHCGLPGELGLLRRAVEVLDGTQARLELARAQVAYGAGLRRAGRRVEARELLLCGRALAAQCSAAPLVALAEVELAAAGGRTRRLEVTGVGALTASERRVCELARDGLRNREIAQQLFVTQKTVEVHLSRSYRKLGIAGREGLAEALHIDALG
ncbi:MAG: AAA family ATPase [Nocardioides sp.]|uniref:helix-turn-helix transcriptional regulator n=1 Tax=Nocardioides sp. TaxID=35761 RepID=UPI0039E52EC5